MSGLALIGGHASPLHSPYIVTEARGRSRGRLWRLERHTVGTRDSVRRGPEIEPSHERTALGSGGRMLRYALAALVDRIYEAEAGLAGELVCFEVTSGSVAREFDQGQAYAEVRRRR